MVVDIYGGDSGSYIIQEAAVTRETLEKAAHYHYSTYFFWWTKQYYVFGSHKHDSINLAWLINYFVLHYNTFYNFKHLLQLDADFLY